MGCPVSHLGGLTGGCIGQVYQVQLTDGRTLVAKVAEGETATLDIEGFMLSYLATHSHLPVPTVYHSNQHLLLMAYLPGNSHFTAAAEVDAARHLAALHNITAPAFGLDQDTLIGGLPQPNGWLDAWLVFFCERRLWYMAQEAERVGRLPASFLPRLERFGGHLDNWLIEPKRPSLIHGDVWTTNVLAKGGRITGFIDPAIYYAHAEIELAFTTLFGTFGRSFFAAYEEIRPLDPGFFEERRDIYNLYPLLVHVRLFGGHYVQAVDNTLRRFGF